MQTWVVQSPSHVRQDNSLPVVSLSLSSFCLCVWVAAYCSYHRTEKRRTVQNGCGQSGETIVEHPGSAKVLLRALLCGAASRSQFCFAWDARPHFKPQQWASLSSSTIIFTHYCKWQDMVVHWRPHLMSSRYVLVIQGETNSNICWDELMRLQCLSTCKCW